MNKTIILFFIFAIHNLYSQETLKDNSIGFVENKGQIINQNNKINKEVCYLLATPGLNVQLRKTGFSYDFYEVDKKSAAIKSTNKNFIGADYPVFDEISNYKIHRVDFDFQNTNPKAKIIALDKCEGYDNFYNLPYSGGVTTVFKYREILYKDIYNNIDLTFFIPEDRSKPVEYNFIIHEGGNISDIKFNISGAKTQLDGNSIKMKLRFGEMKETIPLSWTEGDTRESITINYRNISKNCYGLAFAGATPVSKKIIIDPVPIRIWGSYFGGDVSAFPSKIVSDPANNIYITGSTSSATNIATAGTHQSSIEGNSDGYIVKFNTDGQRIWGTYYPIPPKNVLLDADLNIIFSGNTIANTANISSPGSYQPDKHNYNDTYLVKLNASGIREWGTYYGGSQNDYSYALTADADKNIYITGETNSPDYIASPGSYQDTALTPGNNSDAFIAKFSPQGQRIWGTYYGGSEPEGFFNAAFSADGFLYFAGGSGSSTGISTPGTYQETNLGHDGVIVKFDTAGTRIWGTYFGGENGESFLSGGKLRGDNFYLQGRTSSHNNIGTPGSFMPAYPGSEFEYQYIINFNVATQQKTWGTYYTSQITDMTANGTGEVFFCGDTSNDTDIATPDAYMPVKGGYHKSYLIKLNSTGERIWGTYYGGEKAEQICYLTLDTVGSIYMHGMCNGSLTGIATENAFQTSIPPGTMSTYIVKFRDCASASTVSSNSPLCIGQNIELHAQGGTAYVWTGPNGFTSTQQNPVIPMATAVNNGTYSCFISGTGCDATVTTDIVVGDTLVPVPSLPALPAIYGECSVTVTTIPTAIDNCSGAVNAVTTDPLQYNTIGTYTLHWNYTDNNGNTATQQQTVTVNPASGAVISTEVSFSQCESSSTIFDLSSVKTQITTYPGAVFTFYLSNSDALSQTGAINNPQTFSTTASRDVYALIILPNGCKAVATIHLVINAKPILNNAVLAKCFGAETAEFDLHEAQDIIDPSGILTLSYYASQNDLTTNNAIANSTNFGITGTVQTVYVKGVNSNGCAATSELQVTASNISEMLLPDHNECADPDGNDIAFDLSEYQDEILTLLPTDTYAFEYYGSHNDAYNGTSNSIPAEYTFSSGSREIFFRVMGTTGCPYIIKLNLNIIDNPVLIMNAEYTFCRGSDITITAGDIYDTYEWSTGSLRPEIVISQPGDYSLMVGKITGGVTCYTTKHFTVTASDEPHIDDVIIQDLTDSDNMITVYPDEDTYEYSVDGITYQESNIFTGLQSGMYTVYVRDTARCGIDSRKVMLLMYLKYFSPNGDGKNDYWHIKNSFFSEKMTVYIYDRYGKVLASFNQHIQGWDGTYNGRPMPATDYWFVIERENGTEFKGHFSLLR